MLSNGNYDVAIIGGGLSGLGAALHLKDQRPQTRIVILEKRAHPVPGTAYKVGEALAEISSHYFGEVLGLHSYLENEHLRKMGLRWFASSNGNRDIATRFEAGLARFSPLRTYQIDRGKLENELADLAADRGIDFRDGIEVSGFELGTDSHSVTVGRSGRAEEITARWLVDASGRRALLRNRLGVGIDLPIDAEAAWFRIPHRLVIDDWADDALWRARVPAGTRWRSTCSFVGEGYWTWVINLGSGGCSVGIVTDPRFVPWSRIRRYDALLELLREVEPQLASHLPESESELLDFVKRKRFAHSCTRAFSLRRWCLSGEAAVFIDPLYSTGHDTAAIGNMLLVDLIRRELDGESGRDFSTRLRWHNRAYLGITRAAGSFFAGSLALYRSPGLSVCKLLWDNVNYFGILVPVFRSGILLEPESVQRIQPLVMRQFEMAAFMHELYQQWAQSGRDLSNAGIPIATHAYATELLTTPTRVLTREEVIDLMELQITRLQSISEEYIGRMSDASGMPAPEFPYKPWRKSDEDLLVWFDDTEKMCPPAQWGPQPDDSWYVHPRSANARQPRSAAADHAAQAVRSREPLR
jgi:flavin-dependent dehydrogenase